jgi:tetraacyldisaccharide 4'-kinase
MPDDGGLPQRLAALWYSAARPPFALRLLAQAYGRVLALRSALYTRGILKVRRVAVPVIVVGNISVGGTGKSPLAAWLVDRLKAAGRRPGIASRGYGRTTSGRRLVAEGDDPEQVGDEPLMLRRQTGAPVCVAAQRFEAAEALVAAGCDIIVCDDGLQHTALARDFELAVIDGSRGLGNGWLLPAGPLREEVERLGRVDALVINGEGAAALLGPGRRLLMRLRPEELRAVRGEARQSLDWLRGRELHAVSGIGNPDRFFDLLRSLGAQVHAHPLDDHHRFSAADIDFADSLPVIMTAKDAVKCAALAGPRHWYLPVVAELAPADEQWLMARVLALAPGGTIA